MVEVATQLSKRAARGLERIRTNRASAGAAAAAAAAVAIAGRELAKRADGDDRSQSYALAPKEPADQGLRRIARGRVERALQRLRVESVEDPAEAVHGARKDLKKLRALIRLVRDQLGDSVYRLENGFYRDVGRSLAGSRDATATWEALLALRERYELGARFAGFERELQRRISGDDSDRIAEAATALEAGLGRIERWPLQGDDWSVIEPGLRRTYRRGRRRFRKAASEPSDEALHEWRKRVKDLWYQVRLLQNADRKRLSSQADDLHELADRLGDDHDLVLLRERAEGSSELDGAGREALLEPIERRRGELQLDAFSLGERLYESKPKRFARSIL
jgi:CHAD domain-containing protein